MRTLHHIWEFEADEPIYADLWCSDIDRDGKEEVIALTNNDTLYVLSSEGKKRWSAPMPPKSSIEAMFLDYDSIRINTSTPISYDIDGDGREEILVGSRNKSVYCFDADGDVRWEFMTGGQVNSTAAIAKKERLAIIGSDDGSIYALDARGRLVWKQELGYPITSKIRMMEVGASSYLAFGTSDGKVHVLGTDGSKRWSYQTEGIVHGAPAVGDLTFSGQRSIVIGSSDSHVYSLDLQGNLNWKYRTGGVITSDIVLSKLRKDRLDIILGICSAEKNLLILSGNNRILGSFDAGFWVASAPLVMKSPEGTNIVFGSYDNHVYILTYGKEGITSKIMKYDTGGVVAGQPAISSEGKIFAGNKNGKIVCMEIKGRKNT